jgi:hypothetical protein
MILVTAGPSAIAIPRSEDVHIVPPLAAGQLIEYVRDDHRSILIIDGVFDQSLAVTVAEIRDCIRLGARVFGSTSMGALRAVEAAPVGMVGIGSIFSLVARGEIVSDAELALSFTTEYRSLTVPLVNLRHLCRLLAWSVGDSAGLTQWYEASSRLHFSERSFAALDELAGDAGPGTHRIVAPYLAPECRLLWDLKALDAAAAVADLRARPMRDGSVGLPVLSSSPNTPDRLLNGSQL